MNKSEAIKKSIDLLVSKGMKRSEAIKAIDKWITEALLQEFERATKTK